MFYLLLCVALGCICNSVVIILHLVSHRRGNHQRKGSHHTFDDLRRAAAIQEWQEACRTATDNPSFVESKVDY